MLLAQSLKDSPLLTESDKPNTLNFVRMFGTGKCSRTVVKNVPESKISENIRFRAFWTALRLFLGRFGLGSLAIWTSAPRISAASGLCEGSAPLWLRLRSASASLRLHTALHQLRSSPPVQIAREPSKSTENQPPLVQNARNHLFCVDQNT